MIEEATIMVILTFTPSKMPTGRGLARNSSLFTDSSSELLGLASAISVGAIGHVSDFLSITGTPRRPFNVMIFGLNGLALN